MAGSYMKFEKQDDIGILTLDRAEKYNIVDHNFFDEMYECQMQVEKDRSIRALVIRANGKHFSAGIDLSYLKMADSNHILNNLTWMQNLYGRWQEWPIPVIAAVQGKCIGSGTELILGCDIRMAAENASFSLPEVTFGISPDMGGTTRLTKLVGPGQAKRIILGCEEIDSAEALRIGLVEYRVPDDELSHRAIALAKKIASFPSAAVSLAKKGVNLSVESSVAAGLLFEQAQSAYGCGSDDKVESVNAFLEKRKPNLKR